MAISYPLAIPTSPGFAEIEITPCPMVGESASPFSGVQQTYDWMTDFWQATVRLPENMSRDQAEDWLGWLVAMHGRVGSTLFGDPLGVTARGTWAGTPLVNGAHAARVYTVAVDGFTAGATGKRGDWVQFGTGSSSRLHKVAQDFTANGSGQASIEIWPGLRAALADNDSFTYSSAKGLWKLNINSVPWTIRDVRIGGVALPFIEDLRGL